MKHLTARKIGSVSVKVIFACVMAAGSGILAYEFGGPSNLVGAKNHFEYAQRDLDKRKADLNNKLPLIERAEKECKANAAAKKIKECETFARLDENALKSQVDDAQIEFNAAKTLLGRAEQERSRNGFQTTFVVLFAVLFCFFFPESKPSKQVTEAKPTKQEEWSDYRI